MKKRHKLLMLLLPFLITSCNGKPPTEQKEDFDDGMFEEEESFVVPTLKDDTSSNYVLDDTVKNDGNVNYEIFIRSFYDSDGDGVGDINGITTKLPYLKELGVKDLWLMPFNPTNSYHGYDITDYYDVNPEYGTLDDLKNLISEAKKYDIGIIMDLVINHCSNENPYFIDSYYDYIGGNTGPGSKATWFNWNERHLSGYNSYNGEHVYYESRFSKHMPDFNLDNPEVRAEIKKICEYWLNLGIKGFRLDAVLYYYFGNDSSNIKFLKWLKETCESIKPNTYIVGEAWNSTWIKLKDYYNSGIDSFFNFPSSIEGYQNEAIVGVSKCINEASKFGRAIETVEKDIKTSNPKAISSYFLSNHDTDRISKNLSGDVHKVAASLTYLMPGTPYMYYGEEIGLKGVRGSNDNSDAKRRLPMIWSKTDKTGECKFPESNRPDLNNTTQVQEGVEDRLNENYSVLNHYKKVINIRNKYSFIRNASFKDLTSKLEDPSKHVLAYELSDGTNKIIIIHNFNNKAIEVGANGVGKRIIDSINTTKKVPELESGKLRIGAYSSVILEP